MEFYRYLFLSKIDFYVIFYQMIIQSHHRLEYKDVQKSNLFYFSISVAHGTRVQPNRLPTGATSKCIFTLILKFGILFLEFISKLQNDKMT